MVRHVLRVLASLFWPLILSGMFSDPNLKSQGRRSLVQLGQVTTLDIVRDSRGGSGSHRVFPERLSDCRAERTFSGKAMSRQPHGRA